MQTKDIKRNKDSRLAAPQKLGGSLIKAVKSNSKEDSQI